MKSLDLHDNHLSEIEDYFFKSLNNLQTLNLSYNALSKLEANSFSELSNLKIRNLSHNILNKFSILGENRKVNINNYFLSEFFSTMI